MRSVFNSGHRQGGSIPRVIKNVTKQFSTFAPMAIAAIGILPLPLMERSIINHMEKAAPGDNIERFDENNSVTVGRVDIVFGFVTRWSRSKLALNLDPDLPVELKHRIGRLADNWRPLIAIVDSFGLVWGKVAREAAVTFARSHHDEDIGVILLSDIRNIFNRTGADRITSVDLITALLDVEESGWCEYQGVRDDQRGSAPVPDAIFFTRRSIFLVGHNIARDLINGPRRRRGPVPFECRPGHTAASTSHART